MAARSEERALAALDGMRTATGRGRPAATARPTDPDGPVWFGREESPLFGWVHRPQGRATGGVVLCPPLLGEQVSTEHTYLLLARELAAAGLVAVRFAYEGTGDSASPTDAPGLVPQWLGDVGRAVTLARSCVDGPVALLGMRMGATLAALAVERGGDVDVDALVLWDPCVSGRSFLRRLQSLHALRFGVSGTATGLVEVPGVALHPDTAADLARLRLPALPADRRALVLLRPGDRRSDAGCAAGGTAGGTDVTLLDAGEQESLLEVEPIDAQVPEHRLAMVRGWLTGVLGDASSTSRSGRSNLGQQATRPPTPPPAQSGSSVGADVHGGNKPTRLWVDVDGVRRPVLERCLRLGSIGLFAIETVPAPSDGGPGSGGLAPCRIGTPPRAAGAEGPVVVFLTTAGASHVGPCRMWVSLARRWAALGVRCIRVDESGIGESPVRPGQRPQVIRSPEAFDDVAEVVAAVAAKSRQVVLVGLCSGAYQALESALELAPLGVLAVNVGLWFTPPEVLAGERVFGRRRIHVHRHAWGPTVGSRLPSPVRIAARHVRRRWHRLRMGGGRGAWQEELVRDGVHVFCLSGDEEEHGVQARDRALHRVRPHHGVTGSFEVELVEGLDHSVLAVRDRDLMTDRLTDRLLAMVELAAGSGAGNGGAA